MSLLKNILERAKNVGLSYYQREPARVHGLVAAAVVAVAGTVGVVVSAPVALGVIGILVPLVVAELTRPKVVPVAKIEAADPFHQEGPDVGV